MQCRVDAVHLRDQLRIGTGDLVERLADVLHPRERIGGRAVGAHHRPLQRGGALLELEHARAVALLHRREVERHDVERLRRSERRLRAVDPLHELHAIRPRRDERSVRSVVEHVAFVLLQLDGLR